MSLPQRFLDWFAARGWAPRAHQLRVLDHAQARESVLLISPTGGGKTLAGFLPSLAEITARGSGEGIHTLYISPLKALAVDIARNLEAPIAEMGLPVIVETRTGDTPHSKRMRQRQKPPDILITTPEQVSLLVADPHAAHLLKGLRTVILDELHHQLTEPRHKFLIAFPKGLYESKTQHSERWASRWREQILCKFRQSVFPLHDAYVEVLQRCQWERLPALCVR